MRQIIARYVCSPQRRLQLFTALSGIVFVFFCMETPSLSFAELPRAFPTDFHARHGFFHVLRWLENVHSADDLVVFLTAMRQFHEETSSTSRQLHPTIQFASAHELLAFLSRVVHWETYLLVSKMGLQWAIVVFLARNKALSQRVAIASICLCILSLLCAKIAQSCLLEVLRQSIHQPTSSQTTEDRTSFLTAFLSTLFLVRYVATAACNGILARGYQLYFGGIPAKWKDVPRYLGSKRLALSTLLYGAAGVGAMAVSATSLRSLSEAALHIESVALSFAFAHLLIHTLELSVEVIPSGEQLQKPKQA